LKLIYAKEERIGNPNLFWGRKKELEYLMNWVEEIPKKINGPVAILSRSKKGKTAMVERLYNIVYSKGSHVIPFYYEVREYPYWVIDFAKEFYLSFVQQYLSFKLRNPEIARSRFDINLLRALADENDCDELVADIYQMEELFNNTENESEIVFYALSAPDRVASITGDFVMQIIDEFHLLTSQIYLDKERKVPFEDLISSYTTLTKSKNAPIIATGSKMGWLKELIHEKLPARFKEINIGNFSLEESMGAVMNYAKVLGKTVTTEQAFYISEVAENDPFYIYCIMLSDYENKKFDTVEDIYEILEYEYTEGKVHVTWKEYFEKTLEGKHNQELKKLLMLLTDNQGKEYEIDEIIKETGLDISEEECRHYLHKLIKGDLILRGNTKYIYKGIHDDVLTKVLKFVYDSNFDFEDFRAKDKYNRDKMISNIKKIDIEKQLEFYNDIKDGLNYETPSVVGKIFKSIAQMFSGSKETAKK
jgi:hypothetical protein